MVERILPQKILLLGDLVLDTYTIGRVDRISPEAPIPVVLMLREEQRVGAAANVAINLKALGMEPLLVSRIGKESASWNLEHLLQQEGVETQFLLVEEGYRLPVKNRIVAGNQQVVRVDSEECFPTLLEEQLVQQVEKLLGSVSLVALSDYAKGLFSSTFLQKVITLAKEHDCFLIVDPKGEDFTKYKGATLIKPNQKEAYLAASLPYNTPLDEVGKKLLLITEAKYILITRGEAGMTLFSSEGLRKDFPIIQKEVRDVTGAGDSVLAMLAAALANNLSLDEAVFFANIAAGIAVEHFGCTKVTLDDVQARLSAGDPAPHSL